MKRVNFFVPHSTTRHAQGIRSLESALEWNKLLEEETAMEDLGSRCQLRN